MKLLKSTALAVCAIVSIISTVTATASAETNYCNPDVKYDDGSFEINVSGTDGARVVIKKVTSYEGILSYYDEKVSGGTYSFQLDSCEYDYKTESYTSYYDIKVYSQQDSLSCYEINNVIIADTGYETNLTYTKYSYDIHFEESDARNYTEDSEYSISDEGIKAISGTVNVFYKPYTLGDVNNDEKIDSKDAVAILKDYANSLITKTSSLNIDAADINKDNKIDSKDAVKVLIYYANSLVNKNIGTLEEYFESL